MTELSKKGIKNSYYNCILYAEISRDMEDYKENTWLKFVEVKTVTCKIKKYSELELDVREKWLVNLNSKQ